MLNLVFEQETALQVTPLQARFVNDNCITYHTPRDMFWIKMHFVENINVKHNANEREWKCEKRIFQRVHSSNIQSMAVVNGEQGNVMIISMDKGGKLCLRNVALAMF